MANETMPVAAATIPCYETADTEVPGSEDYVAVLFLSIPKAPRMVAESFEAACASFYKIGVVFGLSWHRSFPEKYSLRLLLRMLRLLRRDEVREGKTMANKASELKFYRFGWRYFLATMQWHGDGHDYRMQAVQVAARVVGKLSRGDIDSVLHGWGDCEAASESTIPWIPAGLSLGKVALCTALTFW